MNGSRHEAITHVLALVAVAVVLILAAAFIASSVSAPSRSSQTAATSATTPTIGATAEDAAEITDNPQPVAANCPALSASIIVRYGCYQKGKITDIKTLEQKCTPGFEYTVNESKGEITVTPEALPGGPSLAGCTVPPPPQCKTDGMSAKQSTSPAACRVIYCVGVDLTAGAKAGCFAAEGGSTEKVADVATKARETALGDLLSKLNAEEVDPAMTQLGISREDSVVKAAFDNAETSIQQQIQKNDDAIRSIKEYAEGCGLVTCEASASDLAAMRAEQSRLEQENKTLGERMSKLADAEKRLAPTPPERPTPPPETPPIVPPPPYNPNTFPGDLGGGPLGGGGGGLGQLLQGLMKGLGGQQGQGSAPPPGNQNPQTPGTCTPQLVCTNNTLYSRNSQCVDVPMQQCPHGCTGNACNQPP